MDKKHVWVTGEMHTEYWREKPERKSHLGELGLDRNMVLNGSSRNRNGLNRLRIETSVGLLQKLK
jgi:hypothetical protein